MPDRVAFQIGSITVHWYGIMIMLGVIFASYIAFREARRRGEDPDHVWQLFPWILVAGILGARLGFVLANAGDPRYKDIVKVFAIWEGGLSIQGALVGGVLALIIYCRRYAISFFKWGDIIVPGVALGQAIGRWGNFFNQEAFGGKTTLPWGIPISVDRQREVAGSVDPNFVPDPNARFHPTFAYEMLWDLFNFGLLMWLGRQRRFKLLEGDIVWVYLIIYSIGRFAIESLRLDSATVSGVKTPQLVAVLTIIIAWTMLMVRRRPGSGARPADPDMPGGMRGGPATRGMVREDVQAPSPVRRVPRATRNSDASAQAGTSSTQNFSSD